MMGLVMALGAAILVSPTSATANTRQPGATPPMQLIVEQDNGQTVLIHLGGLVRILLPENATTGYRWEIDNFSQDTLESVSTQPHYTNEAAGSAGEVEFIFKARKLGSGEIRLKQWRHWEGDSSIINRFRVNLTVKP
jgi:inhibitor of cysteine peptidase